MSQKNIYPFRTGMTRADKIDWEEVEIADSYTIQRSLTDEEKIEYMRQLPEEDAMEIIGRFVLFMVIVLFVGTVALQVVKWYGGW